LGLQIQVVMVASLGENLGGGAKVVADEQGGRGLGSGRHHLAMGFVGESCGLLRNNSF
jgi:hypothetical protein